MFKGSSLRLTVALSSQTMEARRQWDSIFKVLKKKKEYQPKILFPVTLCIKNKGKSKEITEK